MPVLYPIRAASKLTGLPIDTLRAWERRYRAVTPARSDRGRLYTEADIRRLSLLRAAVEAGHAIGQVAALPDADLEELARASAAARPAAHPGAHAAADGAVPSVLDPFLAAIENFDYALANEELTRLAVLATPRDLVFDTVLPLMRIAGDNWHSGKFQVAQEHLLSACVRNLLGALIRVRRAAPQAVRLLLTTPAGELHEFGILAAAMLAVAYDFQVTYLGPNLPAGEIVNATAKCGPQAVVLGIMHSSVSPATAAEIALIAAKMRAPAELWLGGTGAAGVLDLAAPEARGLEARGLDILVLENLHEFEHHLTRLKTAARPWEQGN